LGKKERKRMQIAEHVHALRFPFGVSERFVYVYLIYGKEIYLIDAGFFGSETVIFDYLRTTGRRPQDISFVIQTHSHPDHIGATPAVAKESGCRVAAHPEEIPWMEDVEKQFRERPTPNFPAFVKGPVKVEVLLKDGDVVDMGGDQSLRVIHTPGHSRGSISLFYEEDGVLFSGDAIPAKGDVPIYEDVVTLIRSIRMLKEIEGIKVLCASWLDPQHGGRAYEAMDDALHYVQYIHEAVLRVHGDSPQLRSEELCARVLKEIGLPEAATRPVVVTSIEAHLQARACENLLE
jgi:hydroxyacylglutathione hydrolase